MVEQSLRNSGHEHDDEQEHSPRIGGFPSSEIVSQERPLKWKLTREELLAMPTDERAIYLNEKLNRIYDALMLQVEADQSGAAIAPEDIEVILHPERKDQYERLDRDLPEH